MGGGLEPSNGFRPEAVDELRSAPQEGPFLACALLARCASPGYCEYEGHRKARLLAGPVMRAMHHSWECREPSFQNLTPHPHPGFVSKGLLIVPRISFRGYLVKAVIIVIASTCVKHGTCQVSYLPFHLVVPKTP